MTLSSFAPFSPQWDEAIIDGVLESTILQFLFTGIYTFILFQAIVCPLRQQHRIITLILIVLFIAILVNLMAMWWMLRSTLVTHDATQNEATRNLVATGSSHAQTVANATLVLAVIVSDVLLAWRCYVVWERKLWMLIGYSAVFFGELAAFPIFIARNVSIGSHWDYTDIYFASSLGVTITASALIVYRIIYVSKHSNINLCQYHYIIEILVESGILYAANILICGILLVMHTCGIATTPGLIRATYCCNSILAPVTGIAPTLITSRIANFQSNSTDSGCFHTVSRISFRADQSETELTSSNNTDPYNGSTNDEKWKVHSV